MNVINNLFCEENFTLNFNPYKNNNSPKYQSNHLLFVFEMLLYQSIKVLAVDGDLEAEAACVLVHTLLLVAQASF